MSDDFELETEKPEGEEDIPQRHIALHSVTALSGMYQNWFLDYASYVILERAVPGLDDGLKPVQRRILHSMKRMDDGRYNKVANIIGHTMQFHPHGMHQLVMRWFSLGRKNFLWICRVTGVIFSLVTVLQLPGISNQGFQNLHLRLYLILKQQNGSSLMMAGTRNRSLFR